MVFFASDNTSAVHPLIMEALIAANHMDHQRSYGNDTLSQELTKAFRNLFDHDSLLVFPVFNGSAANSMALASMVRSYEGIICHRNSHIHQDECGMPELFSGGKLLLVEGEQGRITPEAIRLLLSHAANSGVHHVRPRCISLTQSTECGTVYRPEHIREISMIGKQFGLYLHMDGARIANAAAYLGCPVADITWKAGVDMLSFGGTKNGGMLAEAVICFKPELAEAMPWLQKHVGQLASKQRYLSAQLLALISDGLWLKNASHANAMAQMLEGRLRNVKGCEILFPCEANSVFVRMPPLLHDALKAKGHYFYDWPLYGKEVHRLVTSFMTTEAEIAIFIEDCLKFYFN